MNQGFRPGPPQHQQHFDRRPPFGGQDFRGPPHQHDRFNSPHGQPMRPDERFGGPPQQQLMPHGRAAPAADDKLTSVYVGAIAEGITDNCMERILNACGPVRSWKRMSDPTGKPKGFGFCVYENAESVSRALRILGGEGHGELSEGIELGLPGGAKTRLRLTVEATARNHLEKYRGTRESARDEEEDRDIRDRVLHIAETFADDANRADADDLILSAMADAGRGESPVPENKEEDDLPAEMPAEQRELISREISMFRERSAAKDRQKREEEERRFAQQLDRDRYRRQSDHGARGYQHEAPTDEEEVEQRKLRREAEAKEAFAERERRWMQHEEERLRWLASITLEKETEASGLAARAEDLSTMLSEWNEDAEFKLDEDRRAFFARRLRQRRAEHDMDAQDREEEKRELARKEAEPEAKVEEAVSPTKEVIIGKIMTKEERHQAIQDLIGIIPADQEGLFAWHIKWDFLDSTVLNNKLRPWVTKKIVEYLGGEESDIVEFVMELLQNKTPAPKLLEEMGAALDPEEAEAFVMVLWRMLIYETEARSQGLG
ncbi:uncharacterized protein EV422DRAFT_491626 [Fimicolochytrium jonesii]|uniref:uncharacterized protein n=1 Tax=Fimicolochytrium jonesii TaxID=1396493 RepID=UPI0022FDC550|nr:uncharacterized protein EV422DRAFT_491626 [Fimicolochytrium jonesii]KAI8825744.1 hypothetical protein EV422DRAFT_491626 [Fimicolochytrium jonesii]